MNPNSTIKTVLLGWCIVCAAMAFDTTTAAAPTAHDEDAAKQNGDGVLTAEMLVDLQKVGAVALSPDADAVAYVLEVPRAPDDEPGKSYTELWLARLDGKDGAETRRFTRPKEEIASPGFSPDGKLVTFRVEREDEREGKQVYALPVDGGEAWPLTEHEGSVAAYRFSPDGKRLAFAATDAETDEEKEAKKKGRDWQVQDADPKFRHLHVLDLESGEARRLYDRDLDVVSLTWAPDGERIFFRATETARTDDEYMYSALYSVPAAGGEPEIVVATEGKLGELSVSPDGRRLAFEGAVSLNDPLAQSLFVVPVDGGTARNLTDGYEGSVNWHAWLDADTILMRAVEGERTVLYRVDAKTGARTPHPWPERLIIQDLDVDPKTGRMAAAVTTPEHPAALYVAGKNGAAPEKISDHNPELGKIELARQEVVEWQAEDGWTIRGVLTYPLGYEKGKRYPLVLMIHGGPEGVSLDGWTSTPTYPVQLLARDGYVVLQPNYRGSQGRGVAFSKADHDDLGGAEFGDVLAGIDALAERGLIDPNRVGTAGWSYGGYFSAWGATRHSERFKAAVVGAGLTNWLSFAGTTDIPHEMSLVHWDSWWFDEPELHWQRSPLAHIKNANTPVLVVTGAEDKRVHPEQALQLYTALRIREVPTEFVSYPRAPHGLTERAHRLDYIERFLGWFDTYLEVPRVEAMEERKD